MPKTKLIGKDEWGMALHTALRKCCDSTPTSIAYNAICELQISWQKYIKYIVKAAPKGTASEIKTASLKWDAHDVPRQEINVSLILHCAFKLFDDDDWKGFVSFLRQ